MKPQIEKMLDKGVIKEAIRIGLLQPFWSQKSPDGKPKFRFCVDFRAPNSVTKLTLIRCQIRGNGIYTLWV